MRKLKEGETEENFVSEFNWVVKDPRRKIIIIEDNSPKYQPPKYPILHELKLIFKEILNDTKRKSRRINC